MFIDYQGYPGCSTELPSSSREFDTAMAAMRCNDPNPMRQYLGLPLMGPCEDCDREQPLFGHGKSLICLACYAERDAFLNDVYRDQVNEDAGVDRERDSHLEE